MEFTIMSTTTKESVVLILIIMEDTHGVDEFLYLLCYSNHVLILIIMEDTHGASGMW